MRIRSVPVLWGLAAALTASALLPGCEANGVTSRHVLQCDNDNDIRYSGYNPSGHCCSTRCARPAD